VRVQLGAVVLPLVLALVGICGGCGKDETDAALPKYCATRPGPDEDFWRLVEQSCRISTDGDVGQARALRRALSSLDPKQVADFHRALVRINHSLYTRRMAAAADELCLPGLGLGDDLFTDFRSWVIAHGQLAYEWILEDPSRLDRLPDAASGCGLGEPFGDAAFMVYLEKTGRTAEDSGLPTLEPTESPAS
jgi:hypothetical protein